MTTRRPKIDPAIKRRIIQRRKNGATYAELRRDFGVSETTLSKWLKGIAAADAGKVKASRGKVLELRRALLALPDEQADAMLAKLPILVAVAKAVGGVLTSEPAAARVALATLAQLEQPKLGALFGKHVKVSKGSDSDPGIDPVEAIQVQLATLVTQLKAADNRGEITKYTSLSRLLPGILRELRRFVPPEPPDLDTAPDMILAAAQARERLHTLVDRILDGTPDYRAIVTTATQHIEGCRGCSKCKHLAAILGKPTEAEGDEGSESDDDNTERRKR